MIPPPGWTSLDDAEEVRAWSLVQRQLHFLPSTDPAGWPGIVEPEPSCTWDLAPAWRAAPGTERRALSFGGPADAAEILVMDALRACVAPTDSVLALDWQHPCFACVPAEVIDHNVRSWPVSVLPNGDYHLFLERDARFGVFGHPWEATLCVFGAPLVHAVENRITAVPTTLLRRDGRPVVA